MKAFNLVLLAVCALTLSACSDSDKSKKSPASELLEFYKANGAPVSMNSLSSNVWCEVHEQGAKYEESEVLLFKPDGTFVVNYISVEKGTRTVEKHTFSVSGGKITVVVGNEKIVASGWISNEVFDDGSNSLLVTSPQATVEYIACQDSVQE